MNDKKLYQQKMQAQLDEWQADIDKLKAQAAKASADAQLEMNKQIKSLENHLDEGKQKLVQFAKASEEAWELSKQKIEATWDTFTSEFHRATKKFKD